VLVLICFVFPAQAQVVWHSPAQEVQVAAVTILEENWLFLPSGSDLTQLSLTVNGSPLTLDWTAHAQENADHPGLYTGVLPGTQEMLNVIASEHLRSVHIMSEDPENFGRRWLEKDRLHLRETTGRIAILNAQGALDLAMQLTSLRGRGNSTWRNVEHKAPFQFKLEYAADVLKTGVPGGMSRTWALLSHEKDETFLRNEIALDLARKPLSILIPC